MMCDLTSGPRAEKMLTSGSGLRIILEKAL